MVIVVRLIFMTGVIIGLGGGDPLIMSRVVVVPGIMVGTTTAEG
jgi:hypothetical protein